MKTNQDYKNAALAALKGNWAPAVALTVIVLLVSFALVGSAQIPFFRTAAGMLYMNMGTILLSVLFIMPLTIGYYNSSLELYRNGNPDMIGNAFSYGFRNYGRNVWASFLLMLFVSLWSLLLVIPGIIKWYSYAMTPYILNDNPELSANQAIDRSRAMMRGHKFDLFYLHLSFIGWMILSVITLGIGMLWTTPYMYTAQAVFYEDIKSEYEMKIKTA